MKEAILKREVKGKNYTLKEGQKVFIAQKNPSTSLVRTEKDSSKEYLVSNEDLKMEAGGAAGKKKYYAIWDVNEYLATGMNNTSKQGIKEAIIMLREADTDESDLKLMKKMTPDELAESLGYKIDENDEPFREPNGDNDDYAKGGKAGKKVYVVGWEGAGVSGFDWFNKKLDRDARYEEEKELRKKEPNVVVYRGEMDVTSQREFDVTSEVEKFLEDNDWEKAFMEKGGKAGKKGGGQKEIKKRLEYLRKELRAERISYGELAELQSLAKYIDPSDVELLEAAGVEEKHASGGSMEKGGKADTKRVKLKSGAEGERSRLHTRYSSFDEFESYSEMYGLHERLGYETAEEAWIDNPVVESGTNPDDFRKVSKMEKGGKAGKPKVKSIKKYALSNNGNEVDYDKFVRLTDADVFAQQKSLSAQEVKDILNDLEPDEELDKLDDMDDIVDYLSEKGIIKKGNTYNQSFWGNAIEYGVMGIGGSDGEQLVFLSMHIGGDVRGNYTKNKAYKYEHIEDVPFYQWNLIVEIETNKGDIRLQSEGDEAYHFIVEKDETGTWEEGDSMKHPDLEEKLDMNKKDIWMAKGGKVGSSAWSNFWGSYANDGALITGGNFFGSTSGHEFGGALIGGLFGLGAGYIAGAASKQKGYPQRVMERDNKYYKWDASKGWVEFTGEEYYAITGGNLYKYNFKEGYHELKIFEKGGKADGRIITFDDGFQFQVVSFDYAKKNWDKEQIYKIFEDEQSESLVDDGRRLDPDSTYGIEIGFKKEKGGKTGRTKVMVAEAMYRDADNYKTTLVLSIPSGLKVSVGDDVDVKKFGLEKDEWQDFISGAMMGKGWDDSRDHYEVEIISVREMKEDDMPINSYEKGGSVHSKKYGLKKVGMTKRGHSIDSKVKALPADGGNRKRLEIGITRVARIEQIKIQDENLKMVEIPMNKTI